MKSEKKVGLFEVIGNFICAALCIAALFVKINRFEGNEIIAVMNIIVAAIWSFLAVYKLIGYIKYNKEKRSINSGFGVQR